MVIFGGSVGGYIILCVLIFKDVFKVGVSYYGVSDLEVLVIDIYKFEFCYLDGLIGFYFEKKEIYK